MSSWPTAVIALLLVLISGVTYATKLGVNYNGFSRAYRSEDVARSGASWMRVFIDVRRLQALGPDAFRRDRDLLAIKRMHQDGYHVIVNLKYDYSSGTFPADASSAEFKALRAFTTQVLQQVYASTDILVVGNEPFIESTTANRAGLVDFYRHITNHVINWSHQTGRRIPIYIGAFNHLEKPRARTPAVKALMRYARNTPAIAGIDLHLHVQAVDQMQQAMRFARSEIGDEKQMIVTEFSLKNYFRKQLTRQLNPRFAAKWQVNPDWQVWQYLNNVVKKPVPQAQWLAFLRSHQWFTRVDGFLSQAKQAMDDQRVTIATYAIRQTQHKIGPRSDPWILNGLWCSQACKPEASGAPSASYWLTPFRQLHPQK